MKFTSQFSEFFTNILEQFVWQNEIFAPLGLFTTTKKFFQINKNSSTSSLTKAEFRIIGWRINSYSDNHRKIQLSQQKVFVRKEKDKKKETKMKIFSKIKKISNFFPDYNHRIKKKKRRKKNINQLKPDFLTRACVN